MIRRLLIGLALLLWTSGAVASDPVTLLESRTTGTVLVFQADGLTLEPMADGFSRIVLPDFSFSNIVGEPRLPRTATMVGHPVGTSVSLQVLARDEETITAHLAPVPTHFPSGDRVAQALFIPSRSYTVDRLMPERNVTIGFAGKMRETPVTQVQFHPVRYNPITGEVIITRQLTVWATFQPDGDVPPPLAARRKPGGDVSAYQAIIRATILNPDVLD